MEKKPKIVIGITLAKPGGATSFVFGFASWLQHKGYEPIVLAGDGQWLFDQCKQEGITCFRVPFLQREIIPWKDLPSLFALWRLLRTLQPDVIHLNSTKMGAIGSLAARWANVPRVVYCIGGWVFLENISPAKKRLYEYVERWTAPLKDVIVCLHPGDVEAARVRHIQPKTNLLAIPNGINLTTFDANLQSRTEARHALHLPENAFIFGTISMFYPPKNLPQYIEACARLHARFPEALFTIIGDGMERSLIEQQIQRFHLEKNVLLLGTKDRAWQYLHAFDAFVLPSTKEGMPFALLEAMAASLPCIVTDVGANRWVLENEVGGWVVPSQSIEALAQAMQEVMEEPERARARGTRARQIVEQRFPLEQTYQHQLDLLRTR